MPKELKILITSGGTTEYIDDVRVLTNISTGKLGALIAARLWDGYVYDPEVPVGQRVLVEHNITYVAPKSAVHPQDVCEEYFEGSNARHIEVRDVDSLMAVMQKEVPEHDVIIHAMAVSDFGFDRVSTTKLKSNDPQAFVAHLAKTIKINPKVISYIKQWNPKCKLIGFKFEVGMSPVALRGIAYESLLKNDCDLVVANDKTEMKQANEHIAYIVDKNKDFVRCQGKDEIAEKLVQYVKELSKD